MRPKVLIAALILLTILFSFGMVKKASADALLFPWVTRSATVTTLISVVNTAESISEACGLPFDHPGELHWEYFYKTDDTDVLNGQTDYCDEHNFFSKSSKDDMVTFDVAGVFNSGMALFNDVGSEPEFVPDFTLPVEDPRRAFLLVDNNTDAHFDDDIGFQTNRDGTLYGEAMIIERGSGAAVGYIAYNARGGVKDDDDDFNLCFADDDHRDMLGEVIGDDDGGLCEMAPVTILPATLVTTKLLVTPTGSDNNDGEGRDNSGCDDRDQRRGDLNAIVQLCASPGPDPEDPDCDCPPGGGGVWNNTEGKISFNVRKNIVCTSGDDISAFMGTVGYERFENTGQAGWTYVDADRGNLAGGDDTGPYCETDEFVIAKVEYAEGDTMFNGAAVTNPPAFVDPGDLFVNNMVWLRNNRNYIDHCTNQAPGDWRCDPDGGLNLIHNEYDDCPLGGG
jgi:hypothetical protein